jgi:hypothetical protein
MSELSPQQNSSAPLRDQEQALSIRRGALRLLHALGLAAVAELPLASGRRADLVALADGGKSGSLKSSPALRIFAPTGSGRNTGSIATGSCSPSRRIFPQLSCPRMRDS